ncbi:MAG TPA: DUF4253 domain-containing protein [Solirubrobacteraceae bacterium]|nr:DUF4253 domain-containing protein [Solirubrobacteraceae bacterium]
MAVVLAGCGDSAVEPPIVSTRPSLTPPRVPDTPTTASPSGCAKAPVQKQDNVRSTVAPPARQVPFFAPRAGKLPGTGSAAVGGIALPPGRRCATFWATDEPTSQAVRLAARLAAAFPRTGLWPVLWIPGNGGPGDYVPGLPGTFAPVYSAGEAVARVNRLKAETVLRRSWARNGPPRTAFPGLAHGNLTAATGRAAADPFGTFISTFPSDETPSNGWVLMLVPCNRPADAIGITGLQQSEVMSDVSINAVVRSWEERFGAIVTAVGPGVLALVVDRPPTSADDARRLAAEQLALAPDDDPNTDHRFWEFGWPD